MPLDDCNRAKAWAAEGIATAKSLLVDPPVRENKSAVGLTPRETEVLRLLARRLTDKEIAAELSMSPRTVMHHVSSILTKLGVSTRREVAAWVDQHRFD